MMLCTSALRVFWWVKISKCRRRVWLGPGHCLEVLDGAAAEGAQGRSQSASAQLVGALPAQAVLAGADADLQRCVHADEAHLRMHKPLSIALAQDCSQT